MKMKSKSVDLRQNTKRREAHVTRRGKETKQRGREEGKDRYQHPKTTTHSRQSPPSIEERRKRE
jgi:hypothetical protein